MFRANVVLSNGSVASPFGLVPGQQQRPAVGALNNNSVYRFGQQTVTQQATYRSEVQQQVVPRPPLVLATVPRPTGYGSVPFAVRPASLIPAAAVRSRTQQITTTKTATNLPFCTNTINNNLAPVVQQQPVDNEQIRRVILQKANIQLESVNSLIKNSKQLGTANPVRNNNPAVNNALLSNNALARNINLANQATQLVLARITAGIGANHAVSARPQPVTYSEQYKAELLKQITAKRNQLLAHRYNNNRTGVTLTEINQKENVDIAPKESVSNQETGSTKQTTLLNPDNEVEEISAAATASSSPDPVMSKHKGHNSRPTSRNSNSSQDSSTSTAKKRRAESPYEQLVKRSRSLQWGQGVQSGSTVTNYQNPAYAGTTKASQDMLDYFIKNHQTESMFQKKTQLRDALLTVIQGAFPNCGLYIVGSSMSGFGTMTSDMDLCLMISDKHIDQSREAPEILYHIKRALNLCSFLRNTTVIRAKVPILRFTDKISGVECDVNINNFVGIRNTHLLRYYSQVDWRVRPMVLFVKRWARFHDINDASKATISSYSLSLMIIHYLQYGCDPPVLPSLQKLYPDLFQGDTDIRNLRLNQQLDYKVQNKQPLGDLFQGFLGYYTNKFDFDRDVISIRLGTRLPVHMAVIQSNAEKNWKNLKIEEPFDLTNTARSCYDTNTFERVKRVIRVSHRKLKQTGKISSLFEHPF